MCSRWTNRGQGTLSDAVAMKLAHEIAVRKADDLAAILYTSGTTGAARAPCCRIATCCPTRRPCAATGVGRARMLIHALPILCMACLSLRTVRCCPARA